VGRYLAAGKTTLLTSQCKIGKTTLLTVLLAKMKAGGELAGRRVATARWRRSGLYLPELPSLDGLERAGDDEVLLPPGLRPPDGDGK
jgi:ABC-type multidrug transport system ATPase subunit